MLAAALDSIGQQYGKMPHELIGMSAEELAFAYTVMKKAKVARDGEKQTS